MDIEPAIKKFFGDIFRPIVTTAVEDAIKKVPAPPSGELITVKQACELLKCSEPTFYSRVHAGVIKLEKNGRRTLVDKQRLLDDLEAGRLRLRKDRHRR